MTRKLHKINVYSAVIEKILPPEGLRKLAPPATWVLHMIDNIMSQCVAINWALLGKRRKFKGKVTDVKTVNILKTKVGLTTFWLAQGDLKFKVWHLKLNCSIFTEANVHFKNGCTGGQKMNEGDRRGVVGWEKKYIFCVPLSSNFAIVNRR